MLARRPESRSGSRGGDRSQRSRLRGGGGGELSKPGLLLFPEVLLSCLFSMLFRRELYLALKVLFWGCRL